MRRLKMLHNILKVTYTDRLFFGFVAVFLIAALVVRLVEPSIHNYWDGVWYCFVSFTSIGYGDYAAVTVIGRVAIMILTLYGIVVLAAIPGIFVSFYQESVRLKQNNEIREKFAHLENLSHEELKELSEKIRQLNNNNKGES